MKRIKGLFLGLSLGLFGVSLVSCDKVNTLNDFKHNIHEYKNEVAVADFKNRLEKLKQNYNVKDYILDATSYSNIIVTGVSAVAEINSGESEAFYNKVISCDMDNNLIEEIINGSSRSYSDGPGLKQNGKDNKNISYMIQNHKGETSLVSKKASLYFPLDISFSDLARKIDPLRTITSVNIFENNDKYNYYIDGKNDNIFTIFFNQYSDQANSLSNESINQIVFLEDSITLTTIQILDEVGMDNSDGKRHVRNVSCDYLNLKFGDVNLERIDSDNFDKYDILEGTDIDYWRSILWEN